ncbi:MAG: hypothetical protein Q7S58_13945 [Candidatus Binatus sp.]|uniref:hypothetical protein n=1 Tax=Candidatus Binatus sp. TaxID=2811406 RepID=UPI002725E5A7|nr:hypothetical protein [Candidatus Binatus sp.]MDO8433502.1 hypothetical protein [Candidatus Binatus sp.]
MGRPVGIVRIRLVEAGRLVWAYEGRNLFVYAGRPALASLLGGDTAGEFASAIGFASGSNPPMVNDTTLTAPAYYKALDSHTLDGNGAVALDWSLSGTDTGALGLTIQELALFANRAAVGLPGATAPTPMIARKTIAPILFTTGMSLSGTWTLTF